MQVHLQGQEVDAQQYRSLPAGTDSGPAQAAGPHPLRPLLPRAAPTLLT